MRARSALGLVVLVSGCLLGVDYEKVAGGPFCAEVAASAPSAPSCNGAQNECGPNRNELCCESAPIPCGTFTRDYDGEGFDETTDREATLSDFRLDRFEVTVGRFRQFVAAGEATQETTPAQGIGAHPKYLNSGWDADDFFAALAADRAALDTALACSDELRSTWTLEVGDNENKPINCVTWYEALLFCAWDGGRLPSEAEWNYAAAGGDEQRMFPWADPPGEIDLDLAVFGCPDGMPGCPVGTSIAPAGAKSNGAGRWGHYDLAGNVAEWVLDHVPDPSDTYLSPCDDCVRIGTGERGVRGGAFNTIHDEGTADALSVSFRGSAPPETRSPGVGIRCVRSVE